MIKTIIGSLAILLTFIGYIPYIGDIIKRKTKPHLSSWVIWGIDTFFLFLTLLALPMWLFAKQPIVSVFLATTIDILAFAPHCQEILE